MAAQRGIPSSAVRALEEALGMGLTAAGDARDTADAVAAEGAYYLEQVTITEASEDDYEYEEIPDDNFSIPEGEEDLAKAIQMAQEQATDTEILERKTVLPSKPAVPEVIEDFLCNFLIKMGMTRTLDCFQSEWYELIQKGVTELRTVGNVPDVYTQIMLLENENKNLKKDLKHYKQAADKAREDLLKIQKERDFHRMHHKRIVQEKKKLISDLKGLKLHYASYEPTIRVLHEKHHTLLKEKMLTSLERDKVVEQISGLQEILKNMEIGHSYHAREMKVDRSREKENTPEGPTQKGLREAREQNKCKTKMKGNTKDSEFPIDMQPNPNLNVCKENLSPAKFDYKLKNIFRLHELPVSCVSMHPQKDMLVSCGEDRLWKVLGLPKGNVLLTGFGHTDWLSDCCFHPSERCRCTLYGHTDSVNSIEFFPFSNTLLTSSADKTLSIWDARTGICEQSLYGHMHSINDAIFDPRGHMIASCDACGVTKLWDFRKLLPIVSIDIGPSPGNEVNFDSSGQVLAQASGNGVIHLLDLKSGEIHKLMGHESEAHTVVFSHDGEILFSGGSDGTVRTWS
ncbi:sperm-associated antigen 16 protein isoform X3 [Trachypithecus francoisi]|uniref:sperm-associated antigen 16 protein isoform X3 n=1 Tax=Trachypithecus francoisi TaxID=54180 RepID=UPI00141B5B68|nr:sperm-associated antigen 16 protein isoform X3 [Trachypithecus francoisi]